MHPSFLDSLLRLTALDRLPRTGWLQAGLPQAESVAAHSTGVALLALALGPRIEPPLDTERAVALAVVHDAPEALTGDLPRSGSRHLPEGAKQSMERGAAEELLGPLGPTSLALWGEYVAGETREARFARLCDKLHLGLQLLAYTRAGARIPESFETGLAALDCAEFAACGELQQSLVAALRASA